MLLAFPIDHAARIYKKPKLTSPAASVHSASNMTQLLAQSSVESFDFPTVDDGSKPSHSYAQLICMAILRSENRRLTLSQIYKWISDNFSFYSPNDSGWQNSIRHNLSLHKNFIKIERTREDPGKGNYWGIEPSTEVLFLKEKSTRKSSAAESFPVMSTRLEPRATLQAVTPLSSTVAAISTSGSCGSTSGSCGPTAGPLSVLLNANHLNTSHSATLIHNKVLGSSKIDQGNLTYQINQHIDHLQNNQDQQQSQPPARNRARHQCSASSAPMPSALPSVDAPASLPEVHHQLFVFPPHPPCARPPSHTVMQHASLPPLTVSDVGLHLNPDLSSDATIPVVDMPSTDDAFDGHADPTDHVLDCSLFSPSPARLCSSPYVPSRSQFHSGRVTPPYNAGYSRALYPDSSSIKSRSKRKYGSVDDSGYLSSLGSSALRQNQKTMLPASETSTKRGRAEEEIARLRGSSYDSPTKGRAIWAELSVSSSPPLCAESSGDAARAGHMPPPLTPVVKLRPPPVAPPSVSPNTNLRIHRDKVRRMLQSPLRRVSAAADHDLSGWSYGFNICDDLGYGLAQWDNHRDHGVGRFTIFQDMDD